MSAPFVERKVIETQGFLTDEDRRELVMGYMRLVMRQVEVLQGMVEQLSYPPQVVVTDLDPGLDPKTMYRADHPPYPKGRE